MAFSGSCSRLPSLNSPLARKIEAIAKARETLPVYPSAIVRNVAEPEPIPEPPERQIIALAEATGNTTGLRTAARQIALYILAERHGVRAAARMLHTIPDAVMIAQGRIGPIVASFALAIEPTTACFSTLFAAFTDTVASPPRSRRELIVLVSESFGVTITDLLAARRDQKLVFPRHVGMWLCKHFTESSYPAIGKSFNRDHTSALHGVRKMEEFIEFHALKPHDTPRAWIDALLPLRPA